MPHFTNGSGESYKTQYNWNQGTIWWSQSLCSVEMCNTPGLGSQPKWQTHCSHQCQNGQGVLRLNPQLSLPRCFTCVWNPYLTQQVWWLGIDNVCIWIPNSLNMYCQFKSGVNRWSPFPCLRELWWSASFLLCWTQIHHLSQECCNHCALPLHIYFCLRWDIK